MSPSGVTAGNAAAAMEAPGVGRAFSPTRAFGRLYTKDLQSLQFTLVLFSVLIVVWDAFLYTRVGVWPEGLPLGLSFIPLGFIPLWVIWEAIQSYRAEWHSGSIYFMLSAPVSGWMQAGSKLAAVATSFTVQALLAIGGTLWLAARELPALPEAREALRALPAGWLTATISEVAATYWLWGLATIVLFQGAYVASQLASRAQFLALLGALVVLPWFVWRIGGLGHYLFAWVPDITLRVPMVGPEVSSGAMLFIDSGPILGWGLALALVFAATAWLLQHVVEV